MRTLGNWWKETGNAEARALGGLASSLVKFDLRSAYQAV